MRTDRISQWCYGMFEHAVLTAREWHAAEPHLVAEAALVKTTANLLAHHTAGCHGVYRW